MLGFQSTTRQVTLTAEPRRFARFWLTGLALGVQTIRRSPPCEQSFPSSLTRHRVLEDAVNRPRGKRLTWQCFIRHSVSNVELQERPRPNQQYHAFKGCPVDDQGPNATFKAQLSEVSP